MAVIADTRELKNDLRECGEHPLTYGQETHGELHLDALRELERFGRIVAWYWRNCGPYPTAVDADSTTSDLQASADRRSREAVSPDGEREF